MNSSEQKCTKPDCDCAEQEMIRLGTEYIKSYPFLKFKNLQEEVNKQDNVPQVKTVATMDAKEYLKRKGLKNPPIDSGISGGGDAPSIRPSDVMIDFAKIYSRHKLIILIEENAAYCSRIAELEAEKTRLQSGIKDFISTVDRLKKEYIPLITALEAERDKYREALELMYNWEMKLDRTHPFSSVLKKAEQALNSKEVGNAKD